MGDFYDVDDPAANLIERRWFAASVRVKALQQECDVMRENMVLAEKAYRDARMQLAELESLCDGLSERLERLEDVRTPPHPMLPEDARILAARRELTAA